MKPTIEPSLEDPVRAGELSFPPSRLEYVTVRPGLPTAAPSLGGMRPDGIVRVSWRDRIEYFACEYTRLTTPKAIESAVATALRYGQAMGLRPLVVSPFLSEERLRTLESEGISGIDLSGNGVNLASEFYLWRSGQPNRYMSSAPIRNVYRGSSSIVPRCFLLRPEYTSLVEWRAFALLRLQPPLLDSTKATVLAPGTVSKVVRTLEEELIVVREADRWRLVDPSSVLRNLRANDRPTPSPPWKARRPSLRARSGGG